MAGLVDYACEDGIARISLDDGKVNVMSATMLAAIDAALDRAEADDAIVVLRSARPGIFSAGFDLKVFAAGDAPASLDMVRRGAELVLRLMSFPQPTIGVLEGHAFPMGTFLLLACDVRLAAQGESRMGLNEVTIAITPPGFAIELAGSRIHPAWLSRTVTLGEMYEPDEALKAGFVDRVVLPDGIAVALGETIAALKGIRRPSRALAKRRLRQSAIDRDLTPAAYEANARGRDFVVLPGRAG